MKPKELVSIGASCLLAACSAFDSATITTTSFLGLDRSRLTSDQTARLRAAETDLRRVRSRREPVHARLESSLRDGGTKMYRGNGYYLVARHSIEHRGSVVGHLIGPSITLERDITGGAPIQYEEVRFVALSQ